MCTYINKASSLACIEPRGTYLASTPSSLTDALTLHPTPVNLHSRRHRHFFFSYSLAPKKNLSLALSIRIHKLPSRCERSLYSQSHVPLGVRKCSTRVEKTSGKYQKRCTARVSFSLVAAVNHPTRHPRRRWRTRKRYPRARSLMVTRIYVSFKIPARALCFALSLCASFLAGRHLRQQQLLL